jgi:hypothetical protein
MANLKAVSNPVLIFQQLSLGGIQKYRVVSNGGICWPDEA